MILRWSLIVRVDHVVILENSHFFIQSHLLLVSTRSLGVTSVEISMLLTVLLFVGGTDWVRFVTSPVVATTALFWREKALWSLVLTRESYTCAGLMYFTISSHHTESFAIAVSAIHRGTMNLHRLCSPLLVGINGLSCRQVRIVMEPASHTYWTAWLLTAT